MKLAVLADIHGNYPALHAVMADLRRIRPDRVVVAGDLVNRGPDNRHVVEAVAAQGWPVIEGNHDRLVVEWVRKEVPLQWYGDPMWAPLGWVAEQVEDWVPYLAELPFQMTVRIEGADPIRIVHGSPRHHREGVFPSLSDAECCEIFAAVNEPLIVCAHTHVPLDRRVNSWRIVNMGAVGVPFNRDPRAQYGLFTLQDDGAWHISFRAVEYDRQPVIEAFATSGYLDTGFVAEIFLHEYKTAASHLYHFEDWAEERKLPLNQKTWRQYLERKQNQ